LASPSRRLTSPITERADCDGWHSAGIQPWGTSTGRGPGGESTSSCSRAPSSTDAREYTARRGGRLGRFERGRRARCGPRDVRGRRYQLGANYDPFGNFPDQGSRAHGHRAQPRDERFCVRVCRATFDVIEVELDSTRQRLSHLRPMACPPMRPMVAVCSPPHKARRSAAASAAQLVTPRAVMTASCGVKGRGAPRWFAALRCRAHNVRRRTCPAGSPTVGAVFPGTMRGRARCGAVQAKRGEPSWSPTSPSRHTSRHRPRVTSLRSRGRPLTAGLCAVVTTATIGRIGGQAIGRQVAEARGACCQLHSITVEGRAAIHVRKALRRG